MLEQQDSSTGDGGGVPAAVSDEEHDCGGGRGRACGSENGDLIKNGGGGGESDCDGKEGGRGSRNSDSIGDASNQNDSSVGGGDGATTSTTATTTVRIHTTYKKRASKFMNRPNVQNGLGAHSLLHPYGGSSNGGLGGSASKMFNSTNNYSSGSSGNLNSSNNNKISNSVSTLLAGSNRPHHLQSHRSITTRNSLFGGGRSGGGGGSGGEGSTSPQNNGNGTSTTATSSTTATTVDSRPPFVTTVTRGRFLPSKFDLMVEKSLFTFSSRPKPVGLITKHHCSLSSGPLKENSSQNCQPRGAHDYFNVMWDPHIYRGTTTTLTSSLKQPDTTDLSSSSNRDHQDRYRRRRAFLQGSQNTFNNSTSTTLVPMGEMAGGGHTTTIRSNRYRMTTKVTSRSRTFPPPEGRHQVHVQTEEYLEDLSRDVVKGPEVDAVVQTDPIEDEDLLSTPLADTSDKGKMLPVTTCVDASTQVLPGELITFEEQVQPVVDAVVGKILEQALLETMEEEEIGALKAQQNRFLEKRKEEERELKRLQEQQERISAEKERLKRHLEMQFKQRQLQQNGDTAAASGDGQEGGEENNGLSGAADTMAGNGNNGNGVLSTAYLLELLPSVLNSLRQEGFVLDDQSEDDAMSYVPLWQQCTLETSTKPDDEECGDSANPDENMAFTMEDNTNFVPDLDGYQSRASSLELENPTERQDSLTSPAYVEEIEDNEEEAEQQQEEKEDNEENAGGGDSVDATQEAEEAGEEAEEKASEEELDGQEITVNDEPEKAREQEKESDDAEGDIPTSANQEVPEEEEEEEEEEVEAVVVEAEEVDDGGETNSPEGNVDLDESEQPAENIPEESTTQTEENEDKEVESAEMQQKGESEPEEEKETEEADASDANETGTEVVEDTETVEEFPESPPPNPESSAASQKLPNGAIPSMT